MTRRRTPVLAVAIALFAAVAGEASGQEAVLFAGPGRAGAAAPAEAAPVIAGEPMRAGFAVPAGVAAAPPAAFRLFFQAPAPGAEPAECTDAARRLVAAGAARIPGTRELGGLVLAAFGADATVALVDPALRLGPAGLAGVARLPGPATAFALDPVGLRLFVAVAEPPALALVDLAARRAGPVLALPSPAVDLAWEPGLERLLLLDAEGTLAALEPETLAPLRRTALAATGGALAPLPAERLLAVLGGGEGEGRRLLLLDPDSFVVQAEVALPASFGRGADGGSARLAGTDRSALFFAAAGRTALAHDAAGRGRTLARFDLPAPVRALRRLDEARAVAVLADGGAVALDAASGQAWPVASPAAGAAEAAVSAGGALYLRPEASPRLTVLALGALRPGRPPAPAFAEAGTASFGPAALPLLAPLGGTLLAANPGDRRIFQHHAAPGVAAPAAVFTAGGSPLTGLAAAARAPSRTAAGRVELTTEAPGPGRWRLVAFLPEQSRAACTEFEVARGGGGAG